MILVGLYIYIKFCKKLLHYFIELCHIFESVQFGTKNIINLACLLIYQTLIYRIYIVVPNYSI